MKNMQTTPKLKQGDSSGSPTLACSPLLIIKVKRWEYEITEADMFLDNGVCIQLLTQAKQKGSWARKVTPILSKRAIIQIGRFKHIERMNKYGEGSRVFSLANAKGDSQSPDKKL